MADDRDAARTGKAVEHLVAATCILISRSRLNVSTSLVDDEGVDLVFHQRDESATLAVQVKARTMHGKALRERGRFQAPVRDATLRPRPDLYMMFVPVNADDGTFPFVWLIPSERFRDKFREPNGYGNFVFSASSKPASRDQWSEFKCERARLPDRLIDVLERLG